MSRIAFRKLSVLIPVVGPARDLALVHQELSAQLAELGLEHEVLYLVGTGDHETIEEVAKLARDGKAHTRVLRFGETVGEAAMLSTGSDEAEGEVIVTLPPRLETDLAALPALVEAVAAGDAALFRLLPGGRPLAALSARAPGLSERAYRSVAGNRSRFGRLVTDGAKGRADRRIAERATAG